MPQLDKAAVTEWLTACEPSVTTGWLALLRPIEDDDPANDAMAELGRQMDRTSQTVPWPLGPNERQGAEDLREILMQLGVARLLRLLKWLSSEAGPDGAKLLAGLFEGSFGSPDILRGTVQAMLRQALLARIFDDNRLEALLAASGSTAGEEA